MVHCGVLLMDHTRQSELVPRKIRLRLDTAITRSAPPMLAPLLCGLLSPPEPAHRHVPLPARDPVPIPVA